MPRSARKLVLAAAGLLTLLPMTTAMAVGHDYSVTSPGSGVLNFYGPTYSASPTIVFTVGGNTITCTSGQAVGRTATLPAGSSGTNIAKLRGPFMTYSGCTGLSLSFTIFTNRAWRWNATSGSSSGVAGTMTNISFGFNGGSTCQFKVTGSMPFSYANVFTSSGKPALLLGGSGTLAVTPFTGAACGVNPGDPVTYQATYVIHATNPANDPIHMQNP